MRRIVPGILLAAFWLLLLLYGSFPFFWAVILAVSLLATSEYLKMMVGETLQKGDRFLLSVMLSMPVLLSGLWKSSGVVGGLFFSFLLISVYVLFNYGRNKDPFLLFSRLAFGALYIGFLVAHLILIWFLPEGKYWLILLVAITAGSDSGAYYSGRCFGKHLLCPQVSPKKTVEGAAGGLFSGIVVAVLFSYLLFGSVNIKMLLPVAAVLVVGGMIGDLAESMIKRATNTKDSGTILLGHGGVLDRIDSLLLAAPILYYLYIFMGG